MYFVFPWRSSLKYFSRILHVKHIAILMSIWVVVPLVSTRWKSFCIILRNRKYPNTSNNVMHLTGAVMFVITAVRMPDKQPEPTILLWFFYAILVLFVVANVMAGKSIFWTTATEGCSTQICRASVFRRSGSTIIPLTITLSIIIIRIFIDFGCVLWAQQCAISSP